MQGKYTNKQREIWRDKHRDNKSGSIRKYGSAMVTTLTDRGTALVPLHHFDDAGRYAPPVIGDNA